MLWRVVGCEWAMGWGVKAVMQWARADITAHIGLVQYDLHTRVAWCALLLPLCAWLLALSLSLSLSLSLASVLRQKCNWAPHKSGIWSALRSHARDWIQQASLSSGKVELLSIDKYPFQSPSLLHVLSQHFFICNAAPPRLGCPCHHCHDLGHSAFAYSEVRISLTKWWNH